NQDSFPFVNLDFDIEGKQLRIRHQRELDGEIQRGDSLFGWLFRFRFFRLRFLVRRFRLFFTLCLLVFRFLVRCLSLLFVRRFVRSRLSVAVDLSVRVLFFLRFVRVFFFLRFVCVLFLLRFDGPLWFLRPLPTSSLFRRVASGAHESEEQNSTEE